MSGKVRLMTALGCAWLLLAAATGADVGHALWGTPERHLGLVSIAALGAAFWSGWQLSVRESDAVATVCRGAVVAGAVIATWSALQWTDAVSIGVTSSGRLGGPFGSPAYCGAAVVALGPLVVAVAAGDGGGGRAWWRWSARIVLAAMVGVLAGTSSRAAVVAVAAELAAVWVVPAMGRDGGVPTVAHVAGAGDASRGVPRRRRRQILVVALASVPVLAAVVPRLGDGGAGRWSEWRIGLRALSENALLGLGPEGYRVVFPGVVDRDYVARFGRDVVTDRAHNVVLDGALVGGVPIGLALVGLCVWTVVNGVRVVRSSHATASERAAAVASVGLVIHHQFLFLTVDVDVVSLLVIGLMVGSAQRLASGRAAEVPVGASDGSMGAVTGLKGAVVGPMGAGRRVLLAAIAAVVVGVGAAEVVADRLVATAMSVDGELKRTERLGRADDAAAIAPWSIRTHLAAATTTAEAGTAPALREALRRLGTARAISPEDPILRLRDAAWRSEIAAQENSASALAGAVTRWQRLVEADPLLPDGWVGLGRSLARMGDDRSSDDAFRRAAALVPSDARPRAAWAATQASRGRLDDASTTAESALGIDPASPEALAVVELVASLSTGTDDSHGRSDGSR